MTDLTQTNLEEMARLSAEAEARMNEAIEYARKNGLPIPTFKVASESAMEALAEDWDASYEEDWDASWVDSYC